MTKFVNPYNFIPFEDSIPTTKKREEQYVTEGNLLSGWLDVALYMKAPLIIPNGAYPLYIDPETNRVVTNPSEGQKRKLHPKYSFMKYGDSYVIPGSELRGMIRSMYEAVTNSCVHALMDDKPISQRVPADSAINKRGLLSYEDGKWVLYSTKKVLIKKFNPKDKEEAKKFKREIEKWPDLPATKYPDGTYLQYNIPVAINPPSKKMPKGQPYSIYKLSAIDSVHVWEAGDDTPYKELKSALKRDGVKGNQKNSNFKCMEALLSALEDAKRGKDKKVPVYYFDVKRGNENLIYMSGSSIGRIGHHRKWKDVLEGHVPCNGPDYCPACLLFGSIKKPGLKGRIRFGDAYNTDNNIKGEYHTIGILGEPRSSAFEFYFRKPSEAALFWNLDFWSYKNKEGNIEFHDLEKATPRGRKMYWHSIPAKDEEKKSQLNSTMECLQGDTPFKFKVFFDGITREQLKDLEWVIALGENINGSTYQHKLGHAKPLGYGSVKLIIEKENIRSFLNNGDNIGYSVMENKMPDKFEPASIKKDMLSVKSVLSMTNTEITKNKFVAYPHSVKNEEATIFNWFSDNRKNLKRLVVLPEPTDKSIELEGSWAESKPSSKEGKISGRIKFFNEDKGYGFIIGDDGKDYFAHKNSVLCNTSSLLKGTRVYFNSVNGKKGLEAKGVTL